MRKTLLCSFLLFVGLVLGLQAQVLRTAPKEKPMVSVRERIPVTPNALGAPSIGIPRSIQAVDDMFWDTQFGTSSPSDLNVKSIVEQDGKIYVCGNFSSIGDTSYNSLAMWDGERWSRVGVDSRRENGVTTATQLPGTIYCATLSPTGELIIGGSFANAGGVACNNIAKWDGTTFSPIGEGVNGSVNAITYVGNDLYIGGNFTQSGSANVSRIAKWNGTAFQQVKNGIDDGFVNVLVAKGTQLLVGGSFKKIDNIDYNSVVAYNTQTNIWTSLAGGVFYSDPNKTANVFSIAITADNMVYVGGLFEKAGSISARNIAQWNGTQWNQLSTGANEVVTTLYADDNTLYVSGGFDKVGGVSSIFFAKWSSGAWHEIPNPLQGNASTIVKSGNLFYFGGNFELEVTSTFSARGFAVWDGNVWYGIGKNKGNGIDGSVGDIISDGKGGIYVAGNFSNPGGVAAKGFARFNGEVWEAIPGIEASTNTAALKHTEKALLLAGTFSMPNVLTGTGLISLSYETGEITKIGGIKGPINSNIQVIEQQGSNIYIAGNFRMVEADSALSVAMFDGTSWKKLGDGLTGGNVLCLALSPSGTLYAGGTFTRSGTTTLGGIAEWNGTAWQAVAGGVQGSVNSLRWSNNKLYVGGTFTKVGSGIDAANIAEFTPSTSTWAPLGAGCTNTVNAIEIAGNYLYAGGAFRVAGTDTCNRVARYSISESSWAPLGSGVRGGTVYALAATNGSLFVGGDFFAAGLKSSRGIAHWMRNPTSVEEDKPVQELNNSVVVYPNPAQTSVRIQSAQSATLPNANATIQIYSIHGMLVLSTETTSQEIQNGVSIPVESLQNGAYMLRIRSGESTQSATILIAR